MIACQVSRIAVCLGTAVLLALVVPTANSVQGANGHFEVYCDGVGFFLAKIDGAPASGKLVLFLRLDSPGITYVAKEEWKEVYVFRNGCAADGKCKELTHGKVRLDDEITRDGRRLSGKYDIELSDKHSLAGLRQNGAFINIRRDSASEPPR